MKLQKTLENSMSKRCNVLLSEVNTQIHKNINICMHTFIDSYTFM